MSIFSAMLNRRLEHVAQQVTLAEPPMPVFGEHRVIRNAIRQIKTAKQAMRKVQMYLLAEPAFRTDAKAKANE